MLAGMRDTGRMPAIAPPTLSDGVIALRPARDSDVPAIVAACADPEISRWTRVPQPYTPEDARGFLAAAATEAAQGAGVALVVVGADDDRLIGTVGLMDVDRAAGRGEIGYWIAAGERGRGAATRAVVLLRDWAHRALGLTRIEVLPHRDNAPSNRVAVRAGFADTGALVRVPRMPPDRREGYRVYEWRPPDSAE